MSPRPSPDRMQSSAHVKSLPAKAKAGESSCSKSSAKQQRPKDKPKRPLSAYNLFFQHERDRLLRGIHSPFGYSHDANHCTLGRDPSKRANRSKKARPPPHGKIGFAQLAKTIGANWKVLDKPGKEYFETLAAAEKGRYQRELEIWKSKRANSGNCVSMKSSLPSSSTLVASLPSPTVSTGSLPPLVIVTPPNAAEPLPSIPPTTTRNSDGSSYHQHHHYSTSILPPAPPLSYNAHGPPSHPRSSLPQSHQQQGWLDWKSAPQPSSMSYPSHCSHYQQDLAPYCGSSYNNTSMVSGHIDQHHHQQWHNVASEQKKEREAAAYPSRSSDVCSSAKGPGEEVAQGDLLAADRMSSAVENPKDVLDFLANFVRDA
eukprot:CAMPEP_0197443294 /NCGR_PEP_ID=MMETSP1175-20131217/9057_1 /TAXON_ID=1003142 /ORGANISM="Triceratium dubium, Strain CCMP147" /LENGTH=371 /DNA_ID=CAMNT_0042973903 /DNA_START=133 /DNA_END=1248 /DNA_ORIENTATION=+